MITRVARLVSAEYLKLRAHPFLYLALLILTAATLLAAVLQPLFLEQKETAWKAFNSFQLFAYGFKFGLKIATFILLIFSSMTFAGEFDKGTIKNLLTRPITRADFFVAKCVSVVLLALFLHGFVFYVSAAYALARGDLGPVWDGETYLMIRTLGEIAGHAQKALLMSFLPFLAVGFLGILISNWTESSGYAVATALVIFVFGDVVTDMLSLKARPGVFLYYAPYALDKLRVYAEGTNTRWDPNLEERFLYVKVPLLYLVSFVPLAFGIFRFRNIKS